MRQIRRSFNYLDCESFRKIYTAFRICAFFWSPHLARQINTMENIQIRATKLVNGLRNLEYQERLKRLNLPTYETKTRYRPHSNFKHVQAEDMVCSYMYVHQGTAQEELNPTPFTNAQQKYGMACLPTNVVDAEISISLRRNVMTTVKVSL